MLNRVEIDAHHVLDCDPSPRLIQPLITAVVSGADPAKAIRAMIGPWGFDSFVCGFASVPTPTRVAQLYVFATLPDDWLKIYEANNYIEIDPRLRISHDRPTIRTWSSKQFRGVNDRVDAFLNDAHRFGICSGACFTLHNAFNDRVMIGYNSARNETNLEDIESHLGDMYALAMHFQPIFIRSVIENGLRSRLRAVRLTPREIEVLNYVACGLTANDIAPKMSITPRTVRFHVDSACTKMGVLNREEAIALGVKGGLISVFP